MKKKGINLKEEVEYPLLCKIVRIMKLTILLLSLTFFQAFALNSYSQNARISLSLENATITEALKSIEKQSEFYFLYSSKMINEDKNVSINVKNKRIDQVLNQIFANTTIDFVVIDKQIVVSDKTQLAKFKGTKKQVQIKGTVKDEQGEPLIGVSIREKGTSNGTITDLDGEFTVSVKDKSSILVFSFIGYVSQEAIVDDNTRLDIILKEDTKHLDEVVVVGYGSQKIKDVTGSLSHVSDDEISERPVIQVSDALAGKAAGVQVVTTSGKPQGGSSIRIRGTTSIAASSEPLYVIDGVPSETMYDLNPNDVESISILKDASTSAIYGAAGANGVVIIKTKRGAQSKGILNFNSYYGFSKLSKKLGTLNNFQYINLMNELGLVTDWSIFTANTDWQDEIYRTAAKQNYQLSFAGTDEKTSYYISANWQSNEGIIINSSSERLSGRMNVDRNVNDWLKVGASLMFARWKDVEVSENVGRGNGSPITGALITPSLIGIFNDDGTYTGNPFSPDWENPVATTNAADRGYSSNRLLGSIFFDAEIIEGLKFSSRISLDNVAGKYMYYLNNFSTEAGRAKEGIASEFTDENLSWNNENLLKYDKEFENHKISLLGGAIFSKNSYYSLSTDASVFANDIVKNINGASQFDNMSSSESHRSNVSYLARVNYAFQNKYLFTGNFRADASTVFGSDNRWGYFPSFSAGWRLTEEGFMQNQGVFDDVKLRIGWGIVGNDKIPAYSFYGKVAPGFNYALGGAAAPGMVAITLENKDLKWEETSQTNIGLDLSFFNNRVGVVIDAYDKKTSDLLLDRPIPTSSGFSFSRQNVGDIQNKGLEFALNSEILKGNDFKWDANFNIAFNKNKVVNLKDGVLNAGELPQRGNVVRVEEGKEIGNFWGYVAEGVDPATGDMIYKDLDGDGFITAENDMQIIGNGLPDFYYGFTNTLVYKGFGLSVFLQGVQGKDVFNASRILTEGMNNHLNQSDVVLNRWRQPGDITDIPKATRGNSDDEAKYNSMISTRFVEDGSFLRVKTITLSYEFSQSLLERLSMSAAKIYVTAENLYTFTDYSGYDPEVSAFGGSNLVQSVDFGSYPQARSIIFGLNISF